jgi:hypothetical protein
MKYIQRSRIGETCLVFLLILQMRYRKPESLKTPKTARLKMLQARFDWACSWTVMVIASYRPRTPLSTALSTVPHLNKKSCNFVSRNIRRCVHTALTMEVSMRHVCAIPWKRAYDPHVKEWLCPREISEQNWII